jgi:hypothetical protein
MYSTPHPYAYAAVVLSGMEKVLMIDPALFAEGESWVLRRGGNIGF